MLNCQCFPLPSRPLRVPSYFRACRHITVVLPRLQSNCHDHRRYTASTVGLTLLPLNTVIAAGFHLSPNHYRGSSLSNMFIVELPTYSISVRTITEGHRSQTSLTLYCRHFLMPSRLWPRCLANEPAHCQMTAVFHSYPYHYRDVS